MSENGTKVRAIFRGKTARALNRMEDPRETLDDSYEQQLELLRQVRMAVAEVATAKKRIELQGEDLGARYERLAVQAAAAIEHGRQDLARTALERRALLEGQVARLQGQYRGLEKQMSQLQLRERNLTEQVAAFRIEKEAIKATYSVSLAQVRANEAVAGVGAQMNGLAANLERSRDRVAQMQARAEATNELINDGTLTDLLSPPDADIERQLAALAAKSAVERQMESLRNDKSVDRSSARSDDSGGGSGWLGIGSLPPT